MDRAPAILVFALLFGCVDEPDPLPRTDALVERCTDDSVPDVRLSRRSSTSGSATYELLSNEDCRLTYFHFQSRGPEPVPYCRSDSGRFWVCATEVFGIEDANGNFVELVDETELSPQASVSFNVREEDASAIGIRFWSYTRGIDVYVWSAIAK
jgi:hypothetical protein